MKSLLRRLRKIARPLPLLAGLVFVACLAGSITSLQMSHAAQLKRERQHRRSQVAHVRDELGKQNQDLARQNAAQQSQLVDLRSRLDSLESTTTTTQRASRSLIQPRPITTTTTAPKVAPPTVKAAAAGRTLSSTAYCLTSKMANGQPAAKQYVAVIKGTYALGTKLTVSDGPYGAGVYTVGDYIGSGSQLDFAMPGDCGGARAWGRRAITVTS